MDYFNILHRKQPLQDHLKNLTDVANLFLTRHTEKLVTYTLALDGT